VSGAGGASGLAVREIPPGASLRGFIDLAWRINERDPNWVPPLRMSVKGVLDRKKHPFHRHADVAYFLAERQGTAVGRIAAIVNHRHNEFHSERTGFFGFFEAEHDVEVARALLETAAAWLKERGMERVLGPLSFSTNEEMPVGVLVDGFESRPYVMMAHNPRYYPGLLEAAGLEKVTDLLAYEFTAGETPSRFTRGVARLAGEQGITVRSLDMKRFREDVATIKSIYNSAWARNWGFVPMTDEEFDHLAKEFRPIVDPDLCLFAEVDGEAVGFSLALPDLNQAFARIRNGRLFPTGLLRFLWHRRRLEGMRVLTLGFRPGYQNAGLGAFLYLRTWETGMARGYRRGECSWILESNQAMRRPLEKVGGQPSRTMRIYGRDL
jgi:GNAT superfamily N-acetyltransferase